MTVARRKGAETKDAARSNRGKNLDAALATVCSVPARLAWFGAACLAVGLGIAAVDPAAQHGSADFTLIKPAAAEDAAGANPIQAVENSEQTTDGRLSPWRIVAASGYPVYRQLDQNMTDWQLVTVGLTFESYAEIETGRGGALELFNGYDRVILASSTAVALPPVSAEISGVTIFQINGQADYEVRTRRRPAEGLFGTIGRLFLTGARPEGSFEVYTPFLVAAVKGTAFRVGVDNDGASVAVTDGVVHVSDTKNGTEVDVKKGKKATADSLTGRLALSSSPNGHKKSNSRGGNSRGGNSEGSNGQGGNGQDGDDQGGDVRGDDGQRGNGQGGTDDRQ